MRCARRFEILRIELGAGRKDRQCRRLQAVGGEDDDDLRNKRIQLQVCLGVLPPVVLRVAGQCKKACAVGTSPQNL